MTHSPCKARPMDLFLYHRETGAKGERAEEMLRKWEEERLPEMFKVYFKSPFQVPKPVSPLPAERRRSPLENCYKRPAPKVSYNIPPKKPRESKPAATATVEDDLDLGHDPVPISLDVPPGFETRPNPSWEGVVFEPPIKVVATDLEMSDDSESESSSSSSGSSSSTDSDNGLRFEPLTITIQNETRGENKSSENEEINKTDKHEKQRKNSVNEKTNLMDNHEKEGKNSSTKDKNDKHEKDSKISGSKEAHKTDKHEKGSRNSHNKDIKKNDKHKKGSKSSEHKNTSETDKCEKENKSHGNEKNNKKDKQEKSKDCVNKGSNKTEQGNKSNDKEKSKDCVNKGSNKTEQGNKSNDKEKSKDCVNKESNKTEQGNKSNDKEKRKDCVNKESNKTEQGNKSNDKEKSKDCVNKESNKTEQGNKSDDKGNSKDSEYNESNKIEQGNKNSNDKGKSKDCVNKESNKTEQGNKSSNDKGKSKDSENKEPNESEKSTNKETNKTDITERNTNAESNRTNNSEESENQESNQMDTLEQTNNNSSNDDTCELENIHFNLEDNYATFMRSLMFSDQSDTYTSMNTDASSSRVPVSNTVVRKLEEDILKKLQEIQEERIILEVGNQQFHTSRVTMRADPHSLFAMLCRKDCPFRPSTSYGRPTYYFDRDSSHFRFILNYLRNGAMVKEDSLPRERRYLLEMLCEARFFRLQGLENAILARLEHASD